MRFNVLPRHEPLEKEQPLFQLGTARNRPQALSASLNRLLQYCIIDYITICYAYYITTNMNTIMPPVILVPAPYLHTAPNRIVSHLTWNRYQPQCLNKHCALSTIRKAGRSWKDAAWT